MSGVEKPPCPFCGYHGQWEGKGVWRVVCTNVTCGAKGPSGTFQAEALIGWTHREPASTPAQGLDAATIERCAQVAESWSDPAFATMHENRCFASIAAAIRALNTASTTTHAEDAIEQAAINLHCHARRVTQSREEAEAAWHIVDEAWRENCRGFARAALQGDAAHTSQEKGE